MPTGQVLKETLLRHGFQFESDTDTEVIPKLAKFVFDKLSEDRKLSDFDEDGGIEPMEKVCQADPNSLFSLS